MSSSLSQSAVTWGDSNNDGEEEEREIQETSSTDRQDVNNAAAELSSCVSYSHPTSSFGRVLKLDKPLHRTGQNLTYGTDLFLWCCIVII